MEKTFLETFAHFSLNTQFWKFSLLAPQPLSLPMVAINAPARYLSWPLRPPCPLSRGVEHSLGGKQRAFYQLVVNRRLNVSLSWKHGPHIREIGSLKIRRNICTQTTNTITHGTSAAFKNTHLCVNHYNSMNAKEKIPFPHLASCQLRHYHVHKYCQCHTYTVWKLHTVWD